MRKDLYRPKDVLVKKKRDKLSIHDVQWFNAITHSMHFGLLYGTFNVKAGKVSGPKLEEKIPLLDNFVEEKKKRFSLKNGHLLMPAFWVVNLHRNQRG